MNAVYLVIGIVVTMWLLTLRITYVIVSLLAVAFFAYSTMYGSYGSYGTMSFDERFMWTVIKWTLLSRQ